MSNKVKVKTIDLTRIEGPIKDLRPIHTLTSYDEANRLLERWSESAPKDGGYHQCRFRIMFQNDKGCEGRYDLRHWSCEQDEGPAIDLKARVRNYCRFYAGLDRPRSMSDEECRKLREVHGVSESKSKEFLKTYDV